MSLKKHPDLSLKRGLEIILTPGVRRSGEFGLSPFTLHVSRFTFHVAFLVLLLCLPTRVPGQAADQTNPPPAEASQPAPPSAVVTATNPPAAAAPAGATNAAAPVAFDPAEPNIRFDFNGLPYGDVVARFAQMVNKPLIADTNIDGTLTFSDSRPYTYTEALETLNLILSLKGVMLMESGRYLRLVPLKELTQMPLRIFRGLDHTDNVKPGEVVTVVLALKNLDASEIAPSITSMLSNAGSVVPLSRGRGLILTDRMANIKRIQSLLDEVDTAPASQRQMRSYTLRNASGVVLADLVNRTFGAATAPRRVEFNQQTKRYQQLPPDPNDYVTAVFDDASRTLVLFGPADRIAMAEDLIKQFEEKSGVPAGELRVFYPQSTSAQDLAGMIRQAMPSVAGERETSAASATKAHLIVDGANNRLIVSAPAAGQLEEIVKLVEKIDVASVTNASPNRFQEVQTTRIFRCHTADPGSVVRILEDALGRRGPRSRGERSFRVILDPNTRSIVLTGTPADMEQAMEIVKQIDSQEAEPRLVRIIPVKTAHPSDLAAKLRQLYQEQSKNLPNAQSSDALILPDDEGNRLILTATAPQLKLIEDLVEQLDTAPGNSTRQLKAITLKYTSAYSVATMIMQLYGRQFRSQDPQRRALATASNDDKTVLVEATPAMLQIIEGAIRTLDVEPARGAFEVRTYHLTQSSATELSQTLARLFSERQPNRGHNTVPEPRFEADPESDTLIVAATAEQFTKIDQLMKELRTSVEVATEIRTFTLKYCDPDQMVQLLETMLEESPPGNPYYRRYRYGYYGMRGPASSDKLRIATAPAQNAVVVQGPPEKLRLAEQLINTLDKEKTEASSTIRTVHLKQAQAEDVAEAVNRTLDSRGSRNQNRRTTITPVGASNSLLIDGTPTEVEEILKIIQDLDKESTGGNLEFHIYRIENGNAQQISRILDQMLRGLTRSRSRFGRASQQVPVTVAVDDRSNSLIISATPDAFKLIDKLLTSLDQAPKRANRTMNLYSLVNADPFDLAAKIEDMYADRPRDERVNAEPDYFSNTLTVIAPTKDFADIDDLIRRLDAAALDHSLQVRMVALDKIPASQMAAMLTNIYSQMSAGQVRVVDKLPLQPKQPAVLKSTPISLVPTNSPPELTETTTNTLSLTSTNEPAGALFFPEVAIAVDTNANALLLSGPAFELDRLQGMIRDLTRAQASNDTELRLYQLKEADPVVVARTLNELFRQDQSQRNQNYGQYPRGNRGPGRGPYRGQNGQPLFIIPPARVTVVAEPRTRSVIVRAQPTDFVLLESLIKQLDVGGLNAQLGFRLVPLENVQADRLLPLLTQMVAQMRLAQPGEPVSITRDPRGNGCFVIARATLLDQLEAMIRKLDTPADYAEAEVLLLPLKNASAPQLADILQGLLRPGTRGETSQEARALQEQVRRLKVQNSEGKPVVLDLTKPIKILADPLRDVAGGSNQLILMSTSDNLKALAGVVALMDTVPSRSKVRVFPLRYADAATLQRMIQDLHRGPGAARIRPEDRPNVAADERTDSLIVSGNETALSVVTNLIAQLDREGPAVSGQIRLVPLKYATAQSLSTALTTLFRQRYQSMSSPEAQKNRPVIVADPRSNSLLIAANVEDNRALDALLEKLDRQPENGAVSITVIGLRHNDSTRVATMLTAVFAAHRQSTTPPGQPPAPQDLVHVEADPLSNAIIVSASPDNLERVKGLLEKIDVEPVAQEGLIQTFTLERADAQRAATMLRSLIDQGIYRPGMLAQGNRRSPRDAIAVTVDPRSNTLIVSASPENLMVVKELIKQIDSQNYGDNADIRLFHLEHARASQLASVLEQFFRSKRAGETAGGSTERSIPVTVTPDDRTGTLLATGSRETFDAVERMIAQLDAEPMVARTTFVVVPLKQATAGKLQATLTQLFARRPAAIRGQMPDPITVVADSWANALIVGASPEDLEMVQSLIKQLDNGQTAPGMEVQVLVLAKADARRVAQTITSLYRTGGPGSASPVTINVDERLNAVIVSAGQADLKRISDLVHKLDSDQVAQVSEIRIFPLTNARATPMASILTQLLNQKPTAMTDASPNRQTLLQFIARSDDGKELIASALKEGVLVVPDQRSNSLLISAPVDYMSLLERLIARLDACSPQMATIKVFTLKNADARQMMTVLTSLFHLQATLQPTANSRTIQYSLVKEDPDPADHEAPEQDEVAASAVVGTAEENALTVTVDLRSNSLLIGGSEHYVNLASQIVETLDSSPAQERKAEVYRLKNSRALEIEAALQNFLREDTQLLTAAVGQQAMAQELLDREATIVAETNSNTLLISATPRNFDELKSLVEQLDQPQRQVLIQVLLAEVTLNQGQDLGVEWTYQSGGNPATKTGTDFGLPEALTKFGGFSSAISGDNFSFLFRALESEGRLQVLSRPQILTADNQLATIKVGQSVPIVTSSQVIAINGNNVNTFDYKDVGVTLTVTPRISPDGFVKMDVSPEITQLSSQTVTISPGFDAPIINQRLATTAVSVQSGQSILIGGLISTTDSSTRKSVPWLGHIPLLGVFFRSNSRTHDRTELLIVLTPQILVNSTEPGSTKSTLSATREQLDRSSIKKTFQSDPLQQQILEPLYPDMKTNSPSAKPPPGEPDSQPARGT